MLIVIKGKYLEIKWKRQNHHTTMTQMTEYYKCSECFIELKVVKKVVKCSVYTSTSKHDHPAKTTARKRHGIDHEIKEEIKRLEASGNAPRAIKWKLREMGHVAPNINQINKFLNTIRVAKVDSDTLRYRAARGKPSQSNGIVVMRVDEKKNSKRLSIFAHSQEKPGGIVYEWTRERAPEHTFVDATTNESRQLINNNQKNLVLKLAVPINMMIKQNTVRSLLELKVRTKINSYLMIKNLMMMILVTIWTEKMN